MKIYIYMMNTRTLPLAYTEDMLVAALLGSIVLIHGGDLWMVRKDFFKMVLNTMKRQHGYKFPLIRAGAYEPSTN